MMLEDLDVVMSAPPAASSFDAFDRAAAELEAASRWSADTSRSEPTDRLDRYAVEDDERAEVLRLLRASEAPHVRLWRATRDELGSLVRVAKRDVRSRRIGLLAFAAATILVGTISGIAVTVLAANARDSERTATAAIERARSLQAAERATWTRVHAQNAVGESGVASAIAATDPGVAAPIAVAPPAARIAPTVVAATPAVAVGSAPAVAAAPVRARVSPWRARMMARRARAWHPQAHVAAARPAPRSSGRTTVASAPRMRSISWGGR